ncbi:putative Ton-B dependent hemine receptor [Nitrincola lacisaponensis]|uniref:Putative Ton-B dependent hemine receptor n=1 Tax=Nitrincola lacisaponensis TaxID=267850 RepID=A0A063Y6T1_9GAMM|nr:TonB-dependent receptor [Nitrincola lacisaponensis]KDE40845.1 putative Ton-B dependent hemine receptor [Nitrincola lacisaponensis]
MSQQLSLRLNAVLISLSLAGITPFYAQPLSAQTIASTVQSFNIQAGNFDQVLNRFGLEAGLELYLDGALLQGQTSPGLQGQYTAHEGLRALLDGTGLVAIQQDDGVYRIGSATALQQQRNLANTDNADAVQLDTINVFGSGFTLTRDEQGYNDVYDRDMSTSYIGKTEIERYKGANPADLLQGIAGVFSGDARNSGSMDPNIRGIQGPGRVPLTIDGTEQAITVWRGYNGATNRNYIDPNLLGSIQVIKGPSLERNVYSGVGGAIVAKTIGVDDIVKPGEDFGAELKVEGSSGSVSPRVPRLYTGMDYRDIPGFTPGMLGSLGDPTLRVEPKNSRDYNPFSGNDYALRLAVGKRHEDFDAMLAYAYRQKGNHYSGKRNAGYYSNVYDSRGTTLAELNPLRGLALGFPPGTEVMNTSSEMESWLGKLTWKISDEEKLSFTLRHSDSLYGEVMPSRIQSSGYESGSGRIQWPLSQVDARAYSMEYTLNPESNRWINFYSNLWHTDTRSDTYTAGGTPNFVHHPSTHPDDPYIFNTALRSQDNERTGITLSNKMALLNSLDLTLGGNWQYEKLRSAGLEYDPDSWNGSWSLPRAGRRQEWETNFNFDWRPTDRLSFSAGARYSSYWAFDDYLDQQQKAGNMPTSATAYRGRVVSWTSEAVYTQDDWDAIYQTSYAQNVELLNGLVGGIWTEEQIATRAHQSATQGANQQVQVGETYDKLYTSAWYHDGKGRYFSDESPCTNGELADVENCRVWENSAISSAPDAVNEKRAELTYEEDITAKTQRGHAWTPFFSTTYQLTDASRIYFRYSEAKRYPSMFESTIGFSANQNIYYDIEPEHTFNYELAFIQDLTPWIKAEYADFKLAYFQHKTKNVIERDERWTFSNIEQQTIRGIETQARYDSGRFFADLGLSYILENEVCDEHSAQYASSRQSIVGQASLSIARCVEQGFGGGYLLTQAIPSLSGNLTLGGRFLDRKLELGTRLTYYKAHENKDLDRWVEHFHEFGLNTPFTWDDLLLVDAYASYKFNENMGIELTGTNLTDQYYVDPVTRSMMAAPGRVLKLSLNMNF